MRPSSSVSVNPDQDGKRLAQAVDGGLSFIGICISALQTLIAFAYILFTLGAVLVLAYLISAFTIRHADVVLETLEYTWRCGFYAELSEFLPLFDTVRTYYNNIVCWSNSVGLINQYLTTTLIIKESAKCAISSFQGSIFSIIRDFWEIVNALTVGTIKYIVTLPFINRGTYPVYPITAGFTVLSRELYKVLNCLCNALDVLWRPVLYTLSNIQLHCGLHHLLNGVIGLFNTIVSTSIDIAFNNILSIISNGSILDIFFYTTNTIKLTTIPAFRISFQKICAGVDALGKWISAILNSIICTITVEVRNPQQPDDILYQDFLQCTEGLVALDIAFIVPKTIIIAIRIVQVVIEAVFGLGPAFFDQFYADEWRVDYIWDSIRKPLLLSYVPLNQQESLVDIPVILYPNISCNVTVPLDDDILACSECITSALGNNSFETSLLAFSTILDDTLFPIIQIRIIKPILIDTLFSIMRVAVSLLKFALDVIKKVPTSLFYLAQRSNYDRIFNELGGPENELGGFIAFSNRIFEAAFPGQPSLLVLPSILSHTLKFINEALRTLAYIIATLFKLADDLIFGVKPNTNESVDFTLYICVEGSRCLNPEIAFVWLRNSRSYLYLQSEQVPYVGSPNPPKGTLECFCSILDLEFLDSLNIPQLVGLDIPPLCCGFYNALRTITDLGVFVVNLVCVFVQTLTELFDGDDSRILIFEYYSCLGTECSNINIILSDISDFGACPCLFVEGFDDAIPTSPISSGDLQCICSGLNGAGATLSGALILVRQTAQLVLGALSCIDINTGGFKNTPECTITLPDTIVDLLDRSDNLLDIIINTADNLVCSLSIVFAFDCFDRNVPACIDVNFEGCVQNTCPSYFPFTFIGNDLPLRYNTSLPSQYSDCVDQCGNFTCDACYTKGVQLIDSLVNQSIVYDTVCESSCPAPVCRPSDKFRQLASSVFNLLAAILKIILELVRSILIAAVNAATGGNLNATPIPVGISVFLQVVFDRVGEPLFGIESNTRIEYGVLQHLGKLLNCLIGPEGCRTNKDDPIGVPCVGEWLIELANIGRTYYTGLTTLLIRAVRVLETFIAYVTGKTCPPGPPCVPSPSTLQNAFFESIKDFFLYAVDFIFNVVISSFQILSDIMASLIASIISGIIGSGYDVIFTGIKTVFDIFVNILLLLTDPLAFITNLLGLKRGVSSNIINPAWVELYKLTPETVTLLGNVTALLGHVSNDTYCYKVLSTIAANAIHINTYESLGLFDQLAFKTCYILVAVPIMENSRGDNIQLPLDITYNPSVLLDSLTDTLFIMAQKEQWNSIAAHTGNVMYDGSDMGTEVTPLKGSLMELYTSLPLIRPDLLKRSSMMVQQSPTGVINTSQYNSFADYIRGEYPTLANKPLASTFLQKYGTENHTAMMDSRLNISFILLKALTTGNDTLLPDVTRGMEKMTWFWNLQEVSKKRSQERVTRVPQDQKPVHMLRLATDTLLYSLPKVVSYFKVKIIHRLSPSSVVDPSVNTSSSSDSDALPPPSPQTAIANVSHILYNVIGFRFLLISEVVNYIITTRYTEIKEASYAFINSTMDTYTETVKKRSYDDRHANIPTLPEKILSIIDTLKKIRQFAPYIPEVPEKLKQLAMMRQEILQERSLVNVTCGCNCSILDSTLQEVVDIATYCYEKNFLGGITLDVPYNGSIITLLPVNESGTGDIILDTINNLIEFDLFATIIEFFTNPNVDKSIGPVGLFYYVKRSGLVPFLKIKCSRNNLSGQYGIGLEAAIVLALTIALAIFAVYLIIPPFGRCGTFLVIILLGGIGVTAFVTTVVIYAWDYQMNCWEAQEQGIWSFIGLPFSLRMLPETAADDVYNLVTKYVIQQCPVDNIFGKFGLLVDPQVNYSCPMTCPTRVKFSENLSLNSQFSYLGIFISRSLPSVALFLSESCLVRGGCLNGLLFMSDPLVQADGILAPLFQDYNVSEAVDPQLNPKLDALYSLNPMALIVSSILILLSLALALLIFRILIGLLRLIIVIIRAPPVYWLYSSLNDDTEDR
jgi:hypothetical protein